MDKCASKSLLLIGLSKPCGDSFPSSSVRTLMCSDTQIKRETKPAKLPDTLILDLIWCNIPERLRCCINSVSMTY